MAYTTSLPNAPSFPNTRSFPNARSATPPAQDWHAQWGGSFAPTDQPYSLGGIEDPKVSAAWQPTQDIYGNKLGAQPGTPSPYSDTRGLTQWDQAMGHGGWQDPRIQQLQQTQQQMQQTPAPASQSGGGFTPLSQIGRGIGRVAGAIGLPGFGGGNKPAASQTPPPRAPGGWNGETEMLAPEYGGGPAPGNRIMPDGSSWLIGISAATSRQLTPPGTFDPKTQRPVTAPQGPGGGPAPGGGLVLLRAPNGQAKQVPADQVDHYLARGATRG